MDFQLKTIKDSLRFTVRFLPEGTLGLGLSVEPLVKLSLSILSILIVPLASESEGRTDASFPFETT